MHNYLIITGASKGIGKTTAALFLQQGWKVINISRTACDVPQVENILVDLAASDWQEKHKATLLAAISSAKKICLIHNASYYVKDTIRELDLSNLRQMLDIALIAPLQLNKLFLPTMPAGSSILYIGSTLSEKAVAGAASYIISKHAVAGMMKATCQDLDGMGIHTACICPGFTDTEMVREHLKNDPVTLNAVKAMNAMKRLVKPEEIAEVAYFCAEHPVINGAVIHANLGQLEK